MLLAVAVHSQNELLCDKRSQSRAAGVHSKLVEESCQQAARSVGAQQHMNLTLQD